MVITTAIIHPKFRNNRTDNQSILETWVQHIRHLLASGEPVTAAALLPSSSDTDEVADFFARPRAPAMGVNVFSQYLQTQSDETSSIAACPQLRELFVRLNTPLPASAECVPSDSASDDYISLTSDECNLSVE